MFLDPTLQKPPNNKMFVINQHYMKIQTNMLLIGLSVVLALAFTFFNFSFHSKALAIFLVGTISCHQRYPKLQKIFIHVLLVLVLYTLLSWFMMPILLTPYVHSKWLDDCFSVFVILCCFGVLPGYSETSSEEEDADE